MQQELHITGLLSGFSPSDLPKELALFNPTGSPEFPGADCWEQISPRRAEYEIRQKIEGTSLVWRGWYAFRRGLATSLYRCGLRPEDACLILRNSAEVVRKHYIRLEQEGTKVDGVAQIQQRYEQCAATVQ